MRRWSSFLLVVCLARLSAAGLEDGFRQVPTADRPWCYWWWLNGNVDRETITSDLEAMKRVGFGGLLMFDARGYWDDAAHLVLPPAKTGFMSDEWRANLAFAIREAARLGLQVSVNLSSCAGALKGPWAVGADAPKRLIYEARPLNAGAAVDAKLARPDRTWYWDVATFAVRYSGAPLAEPTAWANAGDGVYTMSATSGRRVDGQPATPGWVAEEIVDLTTLVDGDGRLRWSVPAGQWALVRFGSTTIDGHEYDVDVLDAKAVTAHFERMGRAILSDAGPLAGRTLTHFYSVSWEGAVPTWTGDFEAAFQTYRGYAPRPWLPVLAGFQVRDHEASERFVTDYRRARNDCFRDRFYGTLRELCHRAGLRWHAESGGPWVRRPEVFGEADQLAFLGTCDMPQGEFWYTGAADRRGRQMSRPQAMAAHLYGQPLAAAEAFTHMTRHWTPYPALLKRAADESFADGVNQLIWHTFTSAPKAFGVPGPEYFAGTHLNPRVTWFEQARPFLDYLARCQYLLRQGHYVADACVYAGQTPYLHWGRLNEGWGAEAKLKLPAGHGFDLIDDEVLLTRARAQDGAVVLPDGMRYPLVLVDAPDGRAGEKALARIAELKAAGVRVLTSQPAVDGALAEAGLTADFEGPFEYTHRRTDDADIYFVAGSGRADCLFRVQGRQPELWDPVSGAIDRTVGWQTTADGRTRVTLDLAGHGSVFVVFRTTGAPHDGPPPARVSASLDLPGAWTVRFQPGRGAPAEAVFGQLIDWTAHADEGIRHFAGTASYQRSFGLTASQAASPARLQLGTVAALAQVRLNGRDLGVVWTAPWRVDLAGALRPGRNDLIIEVTNTWANRLVGDAALPPEQRLTRSNMAFERGPRTLANYQGFASADALQPSGLLGPVRLEWLTEGP